MEGIFSTINTQRSHVDFTIAWYDPVANTIRTGLESVLRTNTVALAQSVAYREDAGQKQTSSGSNTTSTNG